MTLAHHRSCSVPGLELQDVENAYAAIFCVPCRAGCREPDPAILAFGLALRAFILTSARSACSSRPRLSGSVT